MQQYREALRDRVALLVTLQDIVERLNVEEDLAGFLRQRVRIAVLDKEPLGAKR